MISLLQYNLVASGFDPIAVRSGDAAISAVLDHSPALILLDWMLPGLPGIEVCRRLRKHERTRDLPIIMMSARGLEQDKLEAFAAGVDDYVVKPFSVAELIARIQGLLRRIHHHRDVGVRGAGGLVIDSLAHQVRYQGHEIVLGPIEFRLLEYLAEREDRTLTRAQLIARVWHDSADVNERIVDIHIGHLRRALEEAGVPSWVKTARGVGYVFSTDSD